MTDSINTRSTSGRVSKREGSFRSAEMTRGQFVIAVASICLGSGLSIIDGAIANVALPTIGRDLGIDGSKSVLVVTVYNLVLVMTLLPFASISDRIGLKRCYQAGQALFCVATASCIFAHDLPTLLIVRALQALGGAASLSVMSALIRAIYPPDKLGRGLAVNTVTVAVAAAMAPTAGGIILTIAPWPWVFAIGAPFAILSLLLGWRGLPALPPRPAASHDALGAGYCMATFGAIFIGLEILTNGHGLLSGSGLVATGIALGLMLVRHELRQANPVMPLDLLRSPRLRMSLAAAISFFIATMLILLSVPFRLEEHAGVAPAMVGLMLAAWPVTTMILAPLSGFVADRFDASRTGALGMAVATLGMLTLARLPARPDLWDVIWRMAVCALGSSLFMIPNNKIILTSAPDHRTAAAGGLLSTTRLVGQTIAGSTMAALFSCHLGAGSLPAYLAASLSFAAACLSLAKPKAADRLTSDIDAEAAALPEQPPPFPKAPSP